MFRVFLFIFLVSLPILEVFSMKKMDIYIQLPTNVGSVEYNWFGSGIQNSLKHSFRQIDSISVVPYTEYAIAYGASQDLSNIKLNKLEKKVPIDVILSAHYKITGDHIEMTVKLVNKRYSNKNRTFTLKGDLKKVGDFLKDLIHTVVNESNLINDTFIKNVSITELEERNLFQGNSFKRSAYINYAKGVEIRHRDPLNARTFLEDALREMPEQQEFLIEAGWISGFLLHYVNESIGYFSKAEVIYKLRKEERAYNYSAVLLFMGQMYQKKGEYQKSIEYLLKAKKASDFISYSGINYIEILTCLGNSYFERGDWDRAMSHFFLVKRMYEGINLTDSIKYADSLNNMGAYYLSDPKSQALSFEYLNRAKKIYETEKYTHKIGYAINLSSLGNYFFQKKSYEESLKSYLQSKEKLEELNLKESKAYADILNNLGIVSVIEKDLPKAIEYYEHAKTIYENLKIEESVNYIYITQNLGYIYFADNPDKALEVLKVGKYNCEKLN